MGVLSLAGKVPRVLVTPTDDLGQVLNSVHGISMEGTINFPTGVQVRAQDPAPGGDPYAPFAGCYVTPAFPPDLARNTDVIFRFRIMRKCCFQR